MSEELKNKLIKYINITKSKMITLSYMYEYLKIPYTPQYDNILNNVILELISEKYLEPLKTSRKNVNGTYCKYRIIERKNVEIVDIKKEIMELADDIKIDYLLKYPEEYVKNKAVIIAISNFLKKPDTTMLTVNERSYKLFRDEKKLKECENFIKKLGIDFKSLYSFDTYEPFIYYENAKFNDKIKRIFIIENKDTFWTFINSLKENFGTFLVIYGEGKKILNSFSYIENFNISKDDVIYYFGDIDYEGINIYTAFKERYLDYKIMPYKIGYETILDIEKSPGAVKNNQNINESNIEKFINEFSENYKLKLKNIFDNNLYIPQEVFNLKIAKEILNKF